MPELSSNSRRTILRIFSLIILLPPFSERRLAATHQWKAPENISLELMTTCSAIEAVEVSVSAVAARLAETVEVVGFSWLLEALALELPASLPLAEAKVILCQWRAFGGGLDLQNVLTLQASGGSLLRHKGNEQRASGGGSSVTRQQVG